LYIYPAKIRKADETAKHLTQNLTINHKIVSVVQNAELAATALQFRKIKINGETFNAVFMTLGKGFAISVDHDRTTGIVGMLVVAHSVAAKEIALVLKSS
jgi:hypothetical protein